MDNPDLSHQWLPFTANRAFAADPRLLVSAEGVYYRDAGGRQLLDSVSGLFCVPAGHGRPEIASAVSEQIRRLDFAPPFQFAHPDGFVLAGELSELLPPGLDRVFFVNSGSEAVETALKGALAYHRARGDAGRTRFIGRERAYHGVNFGGLSVSGMVRNREAFGPGLPGVSHIRATWSPDQAFGWGQPRSGGDLADDLQRAVDLYGASNIAAVIVEPISGSTGVLVPPEGYLERLAEIAAASGILLIFDEVITGFGRTGRAFASQSFGVTPDIITMAKALTNGAVPMGAVAFRRGVHDAVIEAGAPQGIEFFHGYTWSAHPSACAAALAALRIYRDEGLFERAAKLAPTFQQVVLGLKGAGPISDIRGFGLLAGIDLETDGAPGRRGFTVLNELFKAGLVARVTNDTIILAPPFVATETEIRAMVDIVRSVVAAL
ncbi:MAG: aminotransferase class III-fold pyridoxal phosphate-dependent enzyme [Acidimicrobiales bacterium]